MTDEDATDKLRDATQADIQHLRTHALTFCTLVEELFDALNFAAFYLHEALPDLANGRVLPLARIGADDALS